MSPPSSTAEAVPRPGGARARARRSWPSRVASAPESGIGAALLALVVVASIFADGFLSGDNLLNVGRQVALLGIMAVGMTFVIIAGEIDLSVGSIYALGSIVCGLLLGDGVAWWLAVLAGVGSGLAIGVINGVVTARLLIPSFIVTLGTLSVARGLTLIISDGSPISLDDTMPSVSTFGLLGSGKFLGLIPMQLLFMLIVFAIGAVLLARTTIGLRTFATGGNEEASRLAGIDTARVKIFAFALTGALAAFAGILGLSFLSYVQGVTGQGLELSVIAAVIIGGTALSGGSGSMGRTLIGVLIIGVLQNFLALMNVSSFWQTLIVGVVIIVAAGLDRWGGRSGESAR